MRLWARLAPKVSAEALIFLPEFGPRKARRPANKNVGVVLALFIVQVRGIRHVCAQPAVGEHRVSVLQIESRNDERARRRCGIAAKPGGVCRADRRGQMVAAAKNLNSSLLSIVRGDNAEAGTLRGCECIPHLSDRLDEGIPALLFTQVPAAFERKGL